MHTCFPSPSMCCVCSYSIGQNKLMIQRVERPAPLCWAPAGCNETGLAGLDEHVVCFVFHQSGSEEASQKGWASRRETGTFSELACGLCLQTGDRLSCMLAQDKTWEARGAASPGHHPERDMYGRRGLVSGGRRRSSSCCGLTSEKCSSNFCSSFRTRWRKTSLVMRRMKMTKSIYASVHSSHGMETT